MTAKEKAAAKRARWFGEVGWGEVVNGVPHL